MHPALHRKNTPSLALNKYLKILVFYFYYFLRIGFEFFHAVQPPRPVGTSPIAARHRGRGLKLTSEISIEERS